MSTSPTPTMLQRSPARAGRTTRLRRYWWPVRMADWSAGRRDGRCGLPTTGATTQYAHRLATSAEEEGRTVRHQLDLTLAPLLRERSRTIATLALNDELIAQLEQQSTTLKELDTAAPAPTAGSGTVVELAAARARIQLGKDAASARGETLAAQRANRDIQVHIDELNAEIGGAHAMAVSHVGRIVEHYQRRTHTYLRALVRRQPKRTDLAEQLTRTPISMPAWVTEPQRLSEALSPVGPGQATVLSLAPRG